jgi:PAS domain S-box-containing protein
VESKETKENIETGKALRHSEERFQAAMSIIKGTLWTNSPSGQMEGSQPGWESLTGQSYEQYRGYGWASAVHPEDAQPTIDAWMEAVREKKIFDFSHRLLLKNGSWGRFAIRAIPLLDDDGSIREWVGVHTDITEEKAFEEELQRQVNERTVELELSKGKIEEAAGRLRAVFESAQSGLFIFSPVFDDEGEVIDFRFVITNPTFAAYVGQSPSVLDGELGSKWFPGYLTNGVFDMYKETYLTGKMIRKEVHYHVDGHDLYLDLMSAKVGQEVLVTFTDHTQLSKTQLQLERTIEELKRSNASLEEFAYAASHDLKGPIRKIHIFNTRIKESLAGKINETDLRWFDRINQAADRMTNLIDDLLSYSRVTLETSVVYEKIDLNHLLQDLLTDLDLEIENKRASITIEDLPTITGHKQQIGQAFRNLISNSIKYSRPGVTPIIAVSVKTVSGKDAGIPISLTDQYTPFHLFTIEDNGIGFAPGDAKKIFGVFTRLHNAEQYQGTGVGLAIVRKVVENHGGYIVAEGSPMQGAAFKLLLPVRND